MAPTSGGDQEYVPTKDLKSDASPFTGENSAFSPRIDDAAPFRPGTVLAGRYRIVAALGKGGMGEVYRADDLELEQRVALKFLPHNVSRDADRLKRLRNEVKIARQVSHANVCRVYDIGEDQGEQFLSMEFIDGQNLAALLQQVGRLPEDRGVEIARQLCLGLAAAHEKGIVHRDLKPQNIMLDARGRVRITDFGLAGYAEDLSGSEISYGTLAYMAPEQLTGTSVSVRSDLYSLGLVLYELFTGKKAYSAKTRVELRRLHEEGTPSKPSSYVRTLNPAIERIILQCLKRDPKDRPRSALAVLAGLPGPDPLVAALVAGETPSPEMVANAGGVGSISPVTAAGLLSLFLLGMAVILALASHVRLFHSVPFDKSPQELSFIARGICDKLGCVDGVVGKDAKVFVDHSALDYVRRSDASLTRTLRFQSGQPPAFYFVYRQSPELFDPLAMLSSVRDFGRVTPNNPPQIRPGMITVVLDMKGRVLSFVHIPPFGSPAERPSDKEMLETLFKSAGLELQELTATAPDWIPLTYCDHRAAWKGVFPESPGVPLRIEAGTWQGRPVYFQLVGPWTRPHEVDADPRSKDLPALDAAGETGLSLILLVVGGVLAYRNWRLGHADNRGARRLAGYIFVINFLTWTFNADHVASPRIELNLFCGAIGIALFSALSIWVAYLALEPYVRRSWPWRISSWDRLLDGRFRDPLVGRDILIGCVSGVAFNLVLHLDYLAQNWLGLAPDPGSWFVSVDFNRALVRPIMHQQPAVFYAMAWFFIFFLATMVLRRELVALFLVVALGVYFHLFFLGHPGDHQLLRASAGIVCGLLCAFVCRSFGILPLAVGLYVNWTLQFSPITADLSTWYASQSIVALTVIGALAIWGFFFARGNRRLLDTIWLPHPAGLSHASHRED
jgi:serine/threonine-protein kinase